MSLNNLLQNRLFLSYLSGAGNALSQGQPIGPTLNAITQQALGAKSKADLQSRYINILTQMLSGQIPEGWKAVHSDKGITVTVPQSALGETAPQEQTTTGSTGSVNESRLKYVNPSGGQLGDISIADLAGLTSQDVSQALSDALSVEALKGKSISDVLDRMYKSQLIKESQARIEKSKPSVTIPGTDIKLTGDQFVEWYKAASKDERTKAIKNFEYAVEHGYEGEFPEFLNDALTLHEKDYRAATKSGYKGGFHEWMFDLAKAGAPTIIDLVDKKKALSELSGQLYFKSPEWTNDLSEYIGSKDTQFKIFVSDDPKRAYSREVVKFIENKIAAGGGTIEDVELSDDGRIMTWTVRWPSGDVETIRYDIRP